MSTSTPAATGSGGPSSGEGDAGASTFTLQVVSPNSDTLSFQNLPITTTIKQLKAKIRDELPTKPLDEAQRLIYRGRMLAVDTTTMLEVFGQSALASQEPQNIHLVLRQTGPEPSSAPAPAVPATAPPPQALPTVPAPPLVPQLINRPLYQPAAAPGIIGMPAQQPLPQQMQQQQTLHQMAHMHNVMSQRLQQLQQESQRLHQEMTMLQARNNAAMLQGPNHLGQFRPMPVAPNGPTAITQTLQNLINQQQRDRAAEGRHGVQDAGGHAPQMPPHMPHQMPSGRSSPSLHRPEHTTTYTREGVGPNGERFHITVNETTTTLPMHQAHHHHHAGQHPNSALDVQAIMRNADRLAQAGQIGLQRSASTPPTTTTSSTSNPAVVQPGTPRPTTTPATPNISSIPNLPLGSSTQAVNLPTSTSNTSEATVYILSSPTGPRALLVNNGEAFYTPRQSRRHSPPVGAPGPAIVRAPVGLPEFRNRPAGRAARRNIRPGPVNAPHANPAAPGAMVAQAGPLLWLFVRLVGFVWFFTAGNPSWTRWFMVSGLAFLVFIYNTGIFNGAAEQVWGPVRRHLENLIPLGPAPAPPPVERVGPPLPQAGQDPVPNETAAPRREPELDPAVVAARLLEQRRQADRGWLMAQFRRVEHALLLFLASLVPGVGERHIAAREVEANAAEAERQRLIQAAEAANAENTENAGDAPTTDAENSGEATQGEARGNEDNQQDNAAPAPPLIEV